MAAVNIITNICSKSTRDVKAIDMHWLSALGERGPHILPVCSLHDRPIFQTPRDDAGNENGMSTCNSGIGQVTRWLGVWATGNSLPHTAQGPPAF